VKELKRKLLKGGGVALFKKGVSRKAAYFVSLRFLWVKFFENFN
jgi:hypothetical protein